MKIASSGPLLMGDSPRVDVTLDGVLSFFRNQDPPMSPNGRQPVLWVWFSPSEAVEKPPGLPCSRSQANLTWEGEPRMRCCTPQLALGCRGHSRPVEPQPELRHLNDLRMVGAPPPDNPCEAAVCIASICIGFLMSLPTIKTPRYLLLDDRIPRLAYSALP